MPPIVNCPHCGRVCSIMVVTVQGRYICVCQAGCSVTVCTRDGQTRHILDADGCIDAIEWKRTEGRETSATGADVE